MWMKRSRTFTWILCSPPAVVSVKTDSCTIGSSGDVNDKSIGGPWAHFESLLGLLIC
ncbi:hypothetical protein M758_12G175600 [Ceratodon purpureus]|uniref:Secreted protein n=1 Tax=Ceratodon purpureus TaxID=3225 RepID=A0A8T0GBV9_CERPU|nr:hypothetical protein KC19_12G172500 [Ceratodon purpureus]KAG0599748.1 hypothetical protein M758_12G175600 [Ceratodon purpureus]